MTCAAWSLAALLPPDVSTDAGPPRDVPACIPCCASRRSAAASLGDACPGGGVGVKSGSRDPEKNPAPSRTVAAPLAADAEVRARSLEAVTKAVPTFPDEGSSACRSEMCPGGTGIECIPWAPDHGDSPGAPVPEGLALVGRHWRVAAEGGALALAGRVRAKPGARAGDDSKVVTDGAMRLLSPGVPLPRKDLPCSSPRRRSSSLASPTASASAACRSRARCAAHVRRACSAACCVRSSTSRRSSALRARRRLFSTSAASMVCACSMSSLPMRWFSRTVVCMVESSTSPAIAPKLALAAWTRRSISFFIASRWTRWLRSSSATSAACAACSCASASRTPCNSWS
mmetsp:Transcript_28857/g.84596  ORF Transcript_28857/g.84596 Transcript_28857/m.84596 type:complete len:344 (-) Transcript_28857:386-1417(-)